MNVIKSTLCTMIAVLSVNAASAQTLPEKFKVHKPDFIINMDGNPKGIDKNQEWQDWALTQIKKGKIGKDSYTVWAVYSDRDNNPVYASASYGAEVARLSFREKLYVADIKNDFALVFKDENESNYPTINSSAKCVGWMPFDNLLLWEECPKSHSQIYQKGLVVRDTEKDGALDEKDPAYYLGPSDNAKRDNSQLVKDLDILFVMKKATMGNKTYYLLSKEMNCKGRERVIYGWLPKGYVTEWDQRLTLEPTHRSSVVSEYNHLGMKPVIYDQHSESSARQWTNGSKPSGALWTYDKFSNKRMHAYTMRNPIISDASSNVFKVAAIASMLERESAFDPEIEAKLAAMQNKLNNINILFVIDATSSMKKYYAPVTSALENVARLAKNESTIKVGAVVYRDYADAKGRGTIEYKKVTNKIDEVISFLKGIETKSDDPDDWEAMFEGLSTALDTKKMGYGADESNFLILVGDAGNQRKDPSGTPWQRIVEQLADKLLANNINFTAHQVNHAGKNAYDDFSRQIGRMQDLYSEKIASKLRTTVTYESDAKGSFKLVKKSASSELPVYDTYKYAETGNSEDPKTLQVKVLAQIKEFREVVQSNIAVLNQNSLPSNGGLQEERLKDVLRMNGWSDEQIQKRLEYLKKGGSSKFLGYAPEKCVNAQNKIFDYVLFFSHQELTMLINELSKINSSANIDDRQAYYEAFVAMGQGMLGQFNTTEISSMSTDQLLGQIYGVPIELPATGLNISEIMSVDKRKLERYIDTFKDKLTRLKSISNNTYDGRFESNGIVYYWIPILDMPGMTPIDE